jgi:hypothetical protein
MTGDKHDPLDGYRGRQPLTDDEMANDEMLAFQQVREKGVETDLIADVLKADELVMALKSDTVMARVATHAAKRIDTCQQQWTACADPTCERCLNAHREARAARIIIDWIQSEINVGRNAERVVNQKLMEAEAYE